MVTRLQSAAIPFVDSASNTESMFGNFRIGSNPSGDITRRITYVSPGNITGSFPIYTTLQRTGEDYAVVKSGVYRDRLDISIYSPLVTMDRRISSIETYYISSDNSVLETTHPGISGYNLDSDGGSGSLFSLGLLADDFKYSYFEDVVESGISTKLLVVFDGGVGSVDLTTLDSFSGYYLNNGLGVPSGYATRIEMSNYQLPDQYTFISVEDSPGSGGSLGFYQKDPISGVWVDYSSGYPQYPTTIIRVDDSI